jgi:hypothetical protein
MRYLPNFEMRTIVPTGTGSSQSAKSCGIDPTDDGSRENSGIQISRLIPEVEDGPDRRRLEETGDGREKSNVGIRIDERLLVEELSRQIQVRYRV